MNPPKRITDLLLACLRHTPPAELEPMLAQLAASDWQHLIDLAVEQRVAALLYHRLKTHRYATAMPTAIQQTLHKKYSSNALRNLQIYHELGRLIAALTTQKIPVLVLKGVHIAAGIYASMALRTMIDIDILVSPSDLPATIQQLQALGYQPTAPLLSIDAYVAHKHHLPPFTHPKALAAVELHWTITRTQRAYTIAVDELWERSTAVSLNTIATHGFCIEDLLLHICMHATYHHWLQQDIRFLCDIAEIAQRHEEALDWNAVVQRAKVWEWQRGTFLALSAAQQLLGAKIPPQVLVDLETPDVSQLLLNREELQSLLFPEHPDLLNSPTGHFLNFLHNPHLSAKAQLFTKRLFLSRAEMSIHYPVTPDSPWLFFYYFVRLKDLSGRFAHQAWRMWFGDPAMVAVVGQQEKLQRWLEQV